MKKLYLILLIVVIAVQFAVPFQMIRSREAVLRKGELFRFITRPIDPADPFQGRYVRLGIEKDYIPKDSANQSSLKRRTAIFASVGTGDDGFAEFTRISMERPDGSAYIRTRHGGKRYRWNQNAKKRVYLGERIEIPFNRFYMEESKAPRAEQLAAGAARSTNCWVNVRIYKGKAVIEDVFAEGQSLRDLAAEKE